MKNPKGQINLWVAIVGAAGLLGASLLTSWATSNNRVGGVEKAVSVIEEREQNRYVELKESMFRIESKVDKLIEIQIKQPKGK